MDTHTHKSLRHYSWFFNIIQLDKEIDNITVNVPPVGEVMLASYEITCGELAGHSTTFVTNAHNAKIIRDMESTIAVTLLDIGNRDKTKTEWKKPLYSYFNQQVDLGDFIGSNHVDLSIPQYWELLIPRCYNPGYVFLGPLYQDKKTSTQRVSMSAFNNHILARPLKNK